MSQMQNNTDTRTMDQKIADWERELRETEAQLATTMKNMKTDEQYLAEFPTPARKTVDTTIRHLVERVDEVLRLLQSQALPPSEWFLEANYSGDVYMVSPTVRPQTDAEYAAMVQKEQEKFVAAAKGMDDGYQNRRQSIKGLERRIRSLQLRLSQSRPEPTVQEKFERLRDTLPAEQAKVLEDLVMKLQYKAVHTGTFIDIRTATASDMGDPGPDPMAVQ